MAVHVQRGCISLQLVKRRQPVNCFRNCTTGTNYTKKWRKTLHVYSYSFNWGSLNELASILARDVILNDNGLVVINKPYGIGKQKPIINKKREMVEKRLNTALPANNDIYLDDILPFLARKLGYNHLETVKIPERYTSGVTVLSSTEELSQHVANCMKKGKSQGNLIDSYWLVCLGVPDPPLLNTKFGIKHEQDKISGGVQPVLESSWSKNAVERGDIVPVSVVHSTECQGRFASLVEVKPSRNKNHFLRLYMAYMLSPILGDNLYGSRVQKIGEAPIAISPFSDRAKMPKRLDDNILSTLDLQRKDEPFIPTHSHLRRVTIPHFFGKEQSLNLEAPFPEFFEWTCKRFLLKESVKEVEMEV